MRDIAIYERDDPTFVQDLKNSDAAVARVAEWFRGRGWDVRKPPIQVRPTVEQMADYADGGDLFVRRPDREWLRLEVAVRSLDFTGPDDYPYPQIIVDSAHAWEKADPKPVAYMRINRTMTWAAFILSNTSDRWVRRTMRDRRKNRDRTFMMCSKRLAKFVRTAGL